MMPSHSSEGQGAWIEMLKASRVSSTSSMLSPVLKRYSLAQLTECLSACIKPSASSSVPHKLDMKVEVEDLKFKTSLNYRERVGRQPGLWETLSKNNNPTPNVLNV